MLQYFKKTRVRCGESRTQGLRGGVDEAEDVVEDIPVLGAIGKFLLQLENLGEGHGLL